jgi:hypothetical protein
MLLSTLRIIKFIDDSKEGIVIDLWFIRSRFWFFRFMVFFIILTFLLTVRNSYYLLYILFPYMLPTYFTLDWWQLY